MSSDPKCMYKKLPSSHSTLCRVYNLGYGYGKNSKIEESGNRLERYYL